MDFSKKETNIVKGVAICLMFANHLYAFPDRLLHGNSYIPLFPYFNAEFYLGSVGNVCISIFVFLSGYGMFLGHRVSQKTSIRYSLDKVKDFYLVYWVYFLIFVPIGLVFFGDLKSSNSNEIQYSMEGWTFLENFLGWSARYNYEWWFVRMFISLLLLLCPLYLTLANRNIVLLALVSIGLFSTSLITHIGYSGELSFAFWQISFAIGIICARFKLFSSRFIRYLDNSQGLWSFLGIAVFFVVRLRFGPKCDFIFIFPLIYFLIRAILALHLSDFFGYLGRYSFPLWLIHSFFCYYYFQGLIYSPKWSPFIFILLTGLSLLCVLVIEYARIRLTSSSRRVC